MFLGDHNLSCNIFPGSTDKLQVTNELPTDKSDIKVPQDIVSMSKQH